MQQRYLRLTINFGDNEILVLACLRNKVSFLTLELEALRKCRSRQLKAHNANRRTNVILITTAATRRTFWGSKRGEEEIFFTHLRSQTEKIPNF